MTARARSSGPEPRAPANGSAVPSWLAVPHGETAIRREATVFCDGDAIVVPHSCTMAQPHDGKNTRDLMAPDTEPTDEELEAVMAAARDLAIQQRALSDAWIAARLEEVAKYVRENRRPVTPRRGDS